MHFQRTRTLLRILGSLERDQLTAYRMGRMLTDSLLRPAVHERLDWMTVHLDVDAARRQGPGVLQQGNRLTRAW